MTSPSTVNETVFDQLCDILAERNGAQICTIETYTKADCVGDLKGRVTKLSRVNGMVNWNYANAVNKQREREGLDADFVPNARKWGSRVKKTPFIEHTNKQGEYKRYLEMKVERSLGTDYFVDGLPARSEDVTPSLKSRGESRQGVDKEVIVRDYALENILTITCGGTKYDLVR